MNGADLVLVVTAAISALVLIDMAWTWLDGADPDLKEPWDPRTPWCGNPGCQTHTWRDR